MSDDGDAGRDNPYSRAMALSAAASTAASAASAVDAVALQVELDRLCAENDRLKSVKPKAASSWTDVLSWSERRAIWTMRMSNMCNGCIFMAGAVGSFLLPDADAVQTFTRVVLAMYMMCVCARGEGAAGRRGAGRRPGSATPPPPSPSPAPALRTARPPAAAALYPPPPLPHARGAACWARCWRAWSFPRAPQ